MRIKVACFFCPLCLCVGAILSPDAYYLFWKLGQGKVHTCVSGVLSRGYALDVPGYLVGGCGQTSAGLVGLLPPLRGIYP